jgi:hypothetical protein
MVRPDINSDECPDLDTECEIKWIEIRPNDKDQILIGSFYRPPDSDEKAIQELGTYGNISALLYVGSRCVSVPIIISGDELDMMLYSSVPLFVML